MKHLNFVSGKLILSILIVCLFAAPTMAQTQTRSDKSHDPALRGHERVDEISEAVGLNADQKAKAYALEDKFGQDVRKLKMDSGDDMEAFKTGRKKLGQEKEDSFKALLSKEQLAKYENYKTMKQTEAEQQRSNSERKGKPGKPMPSNAKESK
ncbi:MAG: hypothetical protein H6540_01980 [Bacteroidales bacterium]|nr:hypothetical protein [Bacteroidales bacterium]MCB9013887.1 hypothetical protein [Bacteroidales bacterium]